MVFWSTCSAMAAVALLFSFGNFISVKTRAYISSVLVAVIAFIILMYLGIVPGDIAVTAGLSGMVGTFVIPFCLIDVASKMKLRDLLSGWRVVLVVTAATLGIVAICVVIGIPLIGKANAIGSIGPLSGALLATTISQQQAAAMGAPEVGVFVMIVLVLQMLVALPLATICLKKYMAQLQSGGLLSVGSLSSELPGNALAGGDAEVKRSIFSTPKSLECDYFIFFKIALIGFIGYALGSLLAVPTKNIINANLCYLVLGMAAAEIGLLERAPLDKAKSSGIIYFALFSLLLTTFAGVPLDVMLAQMLPAIAIIVIAAVGILAFSALIGRLLKMSPWQSMAIGLCCYLGYPGSQIVVEEVIRASGLTTSEREAALKLMLPNMILGYFVAAVISIISASIAVAYIF